MQEPVTLSDPGIEEDMAADWAKITEKHALPEAPEPETPEKADAPETPVEPEIQTRARNEDGTFAKAPPAPVPEEKVEPETPEPVLGVKGAPLDLAKPPSTWKPVARAEWAKLPETVRAEIHRRETESGQRPAQMAADYQFGKSINEVIAPYRHMIESEGGTPERAVADLMRTAALFRTGTAQAKQAALLGIARQFNVELPQGNPANQAQQPQNPQQPFQDPRVDELLHQIQARDQQRKQEEQAALQATVTQWMESKDEKGAPKYPYLGDVMDVMASLVPQIRNSNTSLSHEQVLQMAYEQAIWANPDVRAVLQAPAPATQDRVREAKRAASVNVPRRASQPAPAKPGKMEDTIEATARELGFFS